MVAAQLERETTELLQALVRFNTVNPPGNERPAIEHLAGYLRAAGFDVELLAADERRPNLVADLRGEADGPTLCFLGHVDTVLAEPGEWTHDPWSGELADGFLWGRGALDMKSQVAAEAVAGAELARSGWRPRAGNLKLVFVSDEETGGDLGAQWLTKEHPERTRCDLLLNEGGGLAFEYDGRRRYGVCCGEKGVFRFTLTALGIAGHASMPKTGDNALLKLGPVLEQLAAAQSAFELTDVAAALITRLGCDPNDPVGALAQIASADPILPIIIEPMLGVTLTPTMARASDKVNVIPSRAQIKIDCRVPPGLGEDAARRRIEQVLGGDHGLEIEFTETVVGNHSSPDSPLMDAIERWLLAADPDGDVVPILLPGFSDSKWFRDAFPECVAYGFFPHRHMSMFDVAPLVHNADERIDVRDLGFAAAFYADIARELVG
jgi:acetylornithine deacetylase/succinyl-diaminopimelate desuccinylase-like protein